MAPSGMRVLMLTPVQFYYACLVPFVPACHAAQLTARASNRRGVWNVPIILDFIVLNRAGISKVQAGFGADLTNNPDSTDRATKGSMFQVLSFQPDCGAVPNTVVSLSVTHLTRQCDHRLTLGCFS